MTTGQNTELDALRESVTELEYSDDQAEIAEQLERVIASAEALLTAAENAADRPMIAEIARELERALHHAADRSEPAIRTKLLVGAGFWSLRAASAEAEEAASLDYRFTPMRPAPAPGGGSPSQSLLEQAAPAKTTEQPAVDQPTARRLSEEPEKVGRPAKAEDNPSSSTPLTVDPSS